ncbi:IS4/IS5 family transposase, partial [Paenibacillus sp. HN-1]|nr:IS4/IS5 family transposase [Paenibacillus sinensis]
MEPYAISLKNKLTSLIREMSAAPAPYIKNPETDFTRKRKLSFEKVMHLLISMGGNSLYKELLESQGYDVNTATTSAFVQQRYKILPSAVEFLFH